MAILCNHRVFEVAPWMAQQAEDFKVLAPQFANNLGIEFVVHGDGLIPHIALAKGFKTDLEPKLKYAFRAFAGKCAFLWTNL